MVIGVSQATILPKHFGQRKKRNKLMSKRLSPGNIQVNPNHHALCYPNNHVFFKCVLPGIQITMVFFFQRGKTVNPIISYPNSSTSPFLVSSTLLGAPTLPSLEAFDTLLQRKKKGLKMAEVLCHGQGNENHGRTMRRSEYF